MLGKKLINAGPVATGGEANTFASENFNTVLYTGNGGTQRIGGYINRGAVFNGSSSYINIPNVNSLFLSKTTSSVSFWFRLLNNSSKVQLFSDYAVESFNYAVSIETNGTLGLGARYNNGSVASAYSTATYDDGNWHHLCVTHDIANSSQKAYVDGNTTPVATLSIPSGSWSSSYQSSAKINIGHQFLPQTSTRSEYLNGTIDQFRIFNKALSSSEVTTLYGETHSSTTISTTDIFDDNSGVALYQLDGNANDTGGVSGKFDSSAAHFNGSSSYIESTSLNYATLPTNTAWSASCWINLGSTSITTTAISLMNPSSPFSGWALFVQNGTVQLAINGSSPVAASGSFATLSANTWMHVVLTYNGSGTTTLYYNGNFGATVSSTISASTNGNFRIGYAGVWSYFDGKIDDVRIYSDALTSTEVGYIYNNTTASIPTDNLEAYYKLDGDARDEQQLHDGVASNVTYAYDGTATNVTYQEATKFQPDLVWIKNRDSSSHWHNIFDSIRGVGERLFSNETNAEDFFATSLTSFDSNGFSISSAQDVNTNNNDFVAWCWKAGGADVLNEEGSIDSQVSANQDAGFSIISYTGNGTAGSTVGHGLSSPPEMVIVKNREDADKWAVYHSAIGNTKFLSLNETSAATTSSAYWNNTSPTSSVFTIGATSPVNSPNTEDYIAYNFHSVDGYSKVGSYTGNFNANGPIVETGFEPQFLMIKRTDGTAGNWFIFDNERSVANERDDFLHPNSSAAETLNNASYSVDFLSNGFQIKGNGDQINGNGGTHIYLAIAADPDTTTPTVENSFDVVTYTGTGSAQEIATDFKPDLVWTKSRSATTSHMVIDSIRGANEIIFSNLTNAQTNSTVDYTSINSNGFSVGTGGSVNTNGANYVSWVWKAGDHDDNLPEINTEGTIDSTVSVNAEAGFSIVKADSGSSNTDTIGHGLSSAPELVIRKRLDNTSGWLVLVNVGGTYYELLLNSDAAATSTTSFATSTTIETRSATSGNEYIWYNFHSVTGYQKVGSYTGTGSAGNSVNVGFAPRWVMIKKTNAGYNWNIYDTLRGANSNGTSRYMLLANSNDVEYTASTVYIDITSTGFSFPNAYSGTNNLNDTYIYLAIK